MITLVTAGVRISVKSKYQEKYSNPDSGHFVFSYEITIENQNEFAVQLLRRHWEVFDSSGTIREIDGEGVVGQQPIIEPGQKYTYESACNLTNTIGTMKGAYTMIRMIDDIMFRVDIPEFELSVPYVLN